MTGGGYQIPFTKYHGLGNDYLVIRARDLPGTLIGEASGDAPGEPLAALARRICDRTLGVVLSQGVAGELGDMLFDAQKHDLKDFAGHRLGRRLRQDLQAGLAKGADVGVKVP